MTELRALAKTFEKSDAGFFQRYPERKAHIRNAYKTECEEEFLSLGLHDKNQRRILLYKAEHEGKEKLLKIPMLAFVDEIIEDTDAVLLPIIEQMMLEAKESMLQ